MTVPSAKHPPNRNVSKELIDIENVIERQIRPVLHIHGGDLILLDYTEAGEVVLEFEGACRGCALKSVTYALGIRQKLLPLDGVSKVTVRGVQISEFALKRAENMYGRYSPWVGTPQSQAQRENLE